MAYKIDSLPVSETVTVKGTYTVTDSDVTSDTLTNIITASNAHINKTAQAVANVTNETNTVPDVPASESDFNNMSWEDIKAMAQDCSQNGSDKYMPMLGWQKNITYSAPLSFSYKVQLVAFNNSEKSDGSGKAGFTFITNVLSNVVGYTNPNGASSIYSTSNLRTQAISAIKSFPSDLQALLETVKVESQKTLTSYDDFLTTDDKAFVPSNRNIFSMASGGGTTFDFYEVNFDTAARIRTFKATGSGTDYWVNFGTMSNSRPSYSWINATGGAGTSPAESSLGLVVCFCI